ncbi:MAG TPA: metallophosphoesterase family protein [Euzebyales bacterium]|nr:metallophosphoesterase family protein [Euzebyales bacterium]
MDVLVLADTHIRRGTSRRLPPRVLDLARDADLILHAGDVVVHEVLDELGRYAPVHAVLGNNDHTLVGELPETLELDLAGVRVGMIHDSGAAKGRERRMARRFPGCDLVVFGHSHIPWDSVGPHGQVLFNPGSPTERRRQPHRTAGVVRLDGGRITDRRIEIVDA